MSALAAKQSAIPKKRIHKTKAELIKEFKDKGEGQKSTNKIKREIQFESDHVVIKSMPKLAQKKQLMQRIPSSSKRVPESYPMAKYVGIPIKPVKLVNAQ